MTTPIPYEPPAIYRTRREEYWPAAFDDAAVYVFYDLGKPEMLALKCPCGVCAEILHLNLRAERSPAWVLQEHKDADDTVSLVEPVVPRCGAAFVLTKNRAIPTSGGRPKLAPSPLTPAPGT